MGYKEKKLRQFIQYTCTKQQRDTNVFNVDRKSIKTIIHCYVKVQYIKTTQV